MLIHLYQVEKKVCESFYFMYWRFYAPENTHYNLRKLCACVTQSYCFSSPIWTFLAPVIVLFDHQLHTHCFMILETVVKKYLMQNWTPIFTKICWKAGVSWRQWFRERLFKLSYPTLCPLRLRVESRQRVNRLESKTGQISLSSVAGAETLGETIE